MSVRLISYSEVETALTCQARWDFSYGGRLAGSTLKPLGIAPILSEGSAWGAGVAAWHQAPPSTQEGVWRAHKALRGALAKDYAKAEEAGVPVPVGRKVADRARMGDILGHYMATAEHLGNLHLIEGELIVPLPSRAGTGNPSSRYALQVFLDGYTIDPDGNQWVVENKLRGQLEDPGLMQKRRQYPWYVWAAARSLGLDPVGVIVEERLNEVPKPPRLVKAKRKGEGIDGLTPSHAVDQVALPADYIALCAQYGVDPHDETVEALGRRRWQQRQRLIFRKGEMDTVSQELISAAKVIRDLDSGELHPIRNATKMHCSGCRFRDICAAPEDSRYVESLFRRTVPKRLRPPREQAVTP